MDDFFRLLGAGARFDRKKNSKTMDMFKANGEANGAEKSLSGKPASIGSLDFFKKPSVEDAASSETTATRTEKRKKRTKKASKKQRKPKKEDRDHENDEDDDHEEDDDEDEDDNEANVKGKGKQANKKRKLDDDGSNQSDEDQDDDGDDGDDDDDSEDENGEAQANSEEIAEVDSGYDPLKVVTFKNKEQVADLRKTMRIKVVGPDVPDPTPTFPTMVEQYKLRSFLVESLTGSGFRKPTAIQMQAFPLIMQKRELFGIAPTGSGKTLAFLLPILHHLKATQKAGFRALVIVPTRELAQQTYREFKKLCGKKKFKACVLTKARANENTLATKNYDILITTPMRLVGLIQQSQVDLKNVEHLVLDEGDRLLELGFLEQVDEILAACSSPNIRHYLFSATLPPNIEELAKSLMRDPVRVTIGLRNTTAATVKQQLVFVGAEEGKLLAIRQLIQRGIRPPVLIFVQSIERAKELFHELIYDGINVDVIHSERTQAQRDQIVTNFRAGKIWVLIATELMSRGMDFKGISLVINYDFPQSVVSYIHRIGRAGRAGREGEAVTYFTKDDAEYLRSIASVMKDSGCDVPDWMLTLKKQNRFQKKQLQRAPPERESISTASTYDLKKIQRKRSAVEKAKNRGPARAQYDASRANMPKKAAKVQKGSK